MRGASAEYREGVGREKRRVRAHERVRESESIPVGSGGVYMYVCASFCVCCVMETLSGSTNDYTAAEPSQ